MSFLDKIRVYMAALHDVSKHDDTRLDPKANASDTRAQRDATNTTSIHPVTDATTTKGFLQTGSGRMVGNDGANNIGLFGFDSTGTMVVKVAKPGFDADTAANANLVFNSSQNTFKIVTSGTYTTTTGFSTVSTPTGGHVTESFNHGLSSIPVVMAFIVDSGVYYPLPYSKFNEGTVYQGLIITVSSDSSKVYFTLATYNQGSNWGTVPIKYYILQETAN